MLTPDQISQIRSGLGIQENSPTTALPSQLSGEDLANHYISVVGGNNQPPQEQSQSSGILPEAIKNTAQTYANAVPNFVQEAGRSDASTSANPLIRTGENALAGASSELGTIFAPISGAINAVSKNIAENKSITENPVLGKMLDFFAGGNEKLTAWSQQHPEAARNLGNLLTVGLVGLGGETDLAEKPIGSLEGIKGGVEDLGAKATEVAQTAKEAVGNLSEKGLNVAKGATKVPESIITSAKDYLTPMDENVKKVLTTGDPNALEPKLNKLFEQGRTAVDTTGAPTPFEITGKEQLGGALKDLKAKMTDLGKQKEATTKAIDNITKVNPREGTPFAEGHGYEKPLYQQQLQPLIDNFSKGLKTVVSKLGLKIAGDGSVVGKEGVISEIPKNSADLKTLGQVNDIITDLKKNPTFSNVDKAVDASQELLYKRSGTIGAEPINAKLEGLMKQQIGKLNSSLKEYAKGFKSDGIGDYGKINEDWSRVNDMYRQLNSKLGKNYSKAGSTIKQIFSPTDSGTKDLITRLEGETGRPIFQDATLSKFVMDALKDPRARSLLEGRGLPPLSKGGWTSRILQVIEDRITDPQGKAMRIIEKNK